MPLVTLPKTTCFPVEKEEEEEEENDDDDDGGGKNGRLRLNYAKVQIYGLHSEERPNNKKDLAANSERTVKPRRGYRAEKN